MQKDCVLAQVQMKEIGETVQIVLDKEPIVGSGVLSVSMQSDTGEEQRL